MMGASPNSEDGKKIEQKLAPEPKSEPEKKPKIKPKKKPVNESKTPLLENQNDESETINTRKFGK